MAAGNWKPNNNGAIQDDILDLEHYKESTFLTSNLVFLLLLRFPLNGYLGYKKPRPSVLRKEEEMNVIHLLIL